MRGAAAGCGNRAGGDDTGLALLLAPRGKTGHANQAIGVAERLGLSWRLVEIAAGPMGRLAAGLGRLPPAQAGHRDTRAPLVIASGRQTVPLARAIAGRPAPRPVVVVLNPPGGDPSDFDLVWASRHDRLSGRADNVVETVTAPGRLAPADLAPAAERLAPRIPHLARPVVSVLVGGASRAYRFGRTEAEELGTVLAGYAAAHEASLLVTTSRRTGAANRRIIAEKLSGASAFVWDGSGENPLAGMIGLADALVVTCESINMLSEAALSGRSLYAWPLPGGRAKFERFHRALAEAGIMRWFDGRLDRWTYAPPDAAAAIADAIRDRFPGIAASAAPPGA